MQVYKLCAIQLTGAMLFDAGHSDDPKLAALAFGIELMLPIGLRDPGITEPLELGPTRPREERLRLIQGTR